jgi:hypothetical protein
VRNSRLAERFEQRDYCARLHWLRGVFLAIFGADEARIEASFCAAINTAREQKSVSLEKRAEATYAEYRRQKTESRRQPRTSFAMFRRMRVIFLKNVSIIS